MRIGGIYQPNSVGREVPRQRHVLPRPLPEPAPDRRPAEDRREPGVQQAVTTRCRAPTRTCRSRRGPSSRQRRRSRSTSCSGWSTRLLALAVLIALIGIVNTLMLSVFERTHEIGLLRAVGMGRRQIRAMIRSESVILAVFGAVIGIIVGTGLGHRPGVRVYVPGRHLHRGAVLEPGGLPDPGRVARPARRQLAGAARRQARRARRHRGGLTAVQSQPFEVLRRHLMVTRSVRAVGHVGHGSAQVGVEVAEGLRRASGRRRRRTGRRPTRAWRRCGSPAAGRRVPSPPARRAARRSGSRCSLSWSRTCSTARGRSGGHRAQYKNALGPRDPGAGVKRWFGTVRA